VLVPAAGLLVTERDRALEGFSLVGAVVFFPRGAIFRSSGFDRIDPVEIDRAVATLLRPLGTTFV
jgi:hypothetical protein